MNIFQPNLMIKEYCGSGYENLVKQNLWRSESLYNLEMTAVLSKMELCFVKKAEKVTTIPFFIKD